MLTGPQVSVTMTPADVTVQVTGTAERVVPLPGLSFPVTVTVTGPVEQLSRPPRKDDAVARPARPHASRPQSRERGSAAAELVLVTPFLFLLLLFAVTAGRLVQGKLDVDSAAQQAAAPRPWPGPPQAAGAQAQPGRAGGAGRAVRQLRPRRRHPGPRQLRPRRRGHRHP